MLSIKTVGVLGNLEKTGVEAAFASIQDWCREQGFGLVSNLQSDHSGPTDGSPFGVGDECMASLFSDVDVLISLGGDGTLLYAAQLVAAAGTPVVAVNLGSLGFHTQVNPEDLASSLARLLTGEFTIERRTMVQVEFANGKSSSETGDIRNLALNDIVISKSAWGHMVTLRLAINGHVVTDISADALIVSTATGSSGYNYAAGGPVFYPTMDALILNALCAHRMRVSPLVIPPDSTLEVSLRPRRPREAAQVLTDGQAWHSLTDSETLKISRADVYLPLVLFKNDFYGKLRDKLRWGGLF